jgi:glycosyltransferase involved in cell wall biosynthesis
MDSGSKATSDATATASMHAGEPGGGATLSIVVPIFNEEACFPTLLHRLIAVRTALAPRPVDLIFVNDGSTDGTQRLIDEAVPCHDFVKVIHFSRNFGHQAALTAGLDYAEGEFVCVIDADLQDPPEIIPDMLQKACDGYDIVYGQRRTRRGETVFKRATAALFYRLLQRICGVNIPADTGDFRLMRRNVVLAFRSMRESHRFIRGMIAWTGFRSVPFLYDRQERHAGTTKYPFVKMLRFATDAIVSFSNLPLRISTYIGLAMTALAVLGAIAVVCLRLFTTFTVPGISAVLFVVLLSGGVQFLILGAIGEYVSRIYEQTKQRPLYVVARTSNLEQ